MTKKIDTAADTKEKKYIQEDWNKACRTQQYDKVKAILESAESVHFNFMEAYQITLEQNDKELLKILLEHEITKEYVNETLSFRVYNSFPELFGGATRVTQDLKTPFYIACEEGKTALVKLMFTFSHVAWNKKSQHEVEFIDEVTHISNHWADVNEWESHCSIQDSSYLTPLVIAIVKGHIEIIHLLIARGEIKPQEEFTLYFKYGSAKIMKDFIRKHQSDLKELITVNYLNTLLKSSSYADSDVILELANIFPSIEIFQGVTFWEKMLQREKSNQGMINYAQKNRILFIETILKENREQEQKDKTYQSTFKLISSLIFEIRRLQGSKKEFKRKEIHILLKWFDEKSETDSVGKLFLWEKFGQTSSLITAEMEKYKTDLTKDVEIQTHLALLREIVIPQKEVEMEAAKRGHPSFSSGAF